MNKNHMWLCLFEYIAHTDQYTCCNIIEILILFHYIEIIVRFNLKDFKHLIKHLAMLTSHTDNCFKLVGVFLELFYKRSHLNGFGSSSKNKYNFFHTYRRASMVVRGRMPLTS